MTALGDKISHHRTRLGLSIGAIATEIGVSKAHICDLENGKAKAWNPSVHTIFGLARALGISPLLLAAAAFDDLEVGK